MMYEKTSMIQQLMSLMEQINAQIESVEEYCKDDDTVAAQLRTSDGRWVMNDLLQAKAQVLSSMVLLEEQIHRELIRSKNLEAFK